jgi:hypothetical protein
MPTISRSGAASPGRIETVKAPRNVGHATFGNLMLR